MPQKAGTSISFVRLEESVAVDYQGNSALMIAAVYGHADAIRLFLSVGARLSVKNK